MNKRLFNLRTESNWKKKSNWHFWKWERKINGYKEKKDPRSCSIYFFYFSLQTYPSYPSRVCYSGFNRLPFKVSNLSSERRHFSPLTFIYIFISFFIFFYLSLKSLEFLLLFWIFTTLVVQNVMLLCKLALVRLNPL